ncbi:MAG: haloacid dehalogenase-like hydrolase, partial [Planctomycetales bacterium]
MADLNRAPQPILFVDLDGTLIVSDLLLEAIIPLIARQSRVLWRLPGWLWQGRAAMKAHLASQVTLDFAHLPFREDVLAFLREQKQAGRRLVLATASDRRWAVGVAEALELFDDVLASDGQRNLKGTRKLEAIEAYCRERGEAAFGYVGDSPADLPIWRQASEIYAVNPSRSLLQRLGPERQPRQVFGSVRHPWREAVRALRPHQWVKNLLVYVPIIAGHRLGDPGTLMAATVCFISLCLCASAVYVLN